MTVEIGFAVLTGALLAVGSFVAVSLPTVFLAPRSGLRSALFTIAAAVAVLVFMGRVIDVLWRFGRRDTAAEAGTADPASPDQPSQPGRTSPDS